jgi:hypothetical protein
MLVNTPDLHSVNNILHRWCVSSDGIAKGLMPLRRSGVVKTGSLWLRLVLL